MHIARGISRSWLWPDRWHALKHRCFLSDLAKEASAGKVGAIVGGFELAIRSPQSQLKKVFGRNLTAYPTALAWTTLFNAPMSVDCRKPKVTQAKYVLTAPGFSHGRNEPRSQWDGYPEVIRARRPVYPASEQPLCCLQQDVLWIVRRKHESKIVKVWYLRPKWNICRHPCWMTIWGNDNRIRQKCVCVTTGLGLLEVCRCIVTTLVKDDFAFALSVTFDN